MSGSCLRPVLEVQGAVVAEPARARRPPCRTPGAGGREEGEGTSPAEGHFSSLPLAPCQLHCAPPTDPRGGNQMLRELSRGLALPEGVRCKQGMSVTREH